MDSYAGEGPPPHTEFSEARHTQQNDVALSLNRYLTELTDILTEMLVVI